MSPDLQKAAQGAPLSDGASHINKAVCQLIPHKRNDEIAAIQHVQDALESALNDLTLTNHTRANLQDMHQYCAQNIEALTTRRALGARAFDGHTLSDTEQAEMQAFLQNHVHIDGPPYLDPHDISAEVRVLNWLIVSADLAKKAEPEMSTSKDYVFACLREQRSTENVTLQRISDTLQLFFSKVKQNESPCDSFSEDTVQVLGTIDWGINFRLEEVEHELAYINNNDARCIRPLTAIELAGYPEYLVEKAEAAQNANGLNQQGQETRVPGIKKRARSADDDDDMVNKEEPQAKQPRQIAQLRLNRFQPPVQTAKLSPTTASWRQSTLSSLTSALSPLHHSSSSSLRKPPTSRFHQQARTKWTWTWIWGCKRYTYLHTSSRSDCQFTSASPSPYHYQAKRYITNTSHRSC